MIGGFEEVTLRNLVKNAAEFHRGICVLSTSGQRAGFSPETADNRLLRNFVNFCQVTLCHNQRGVPPLCVFSTLLSHCHLHRLPAGKST
jgi:hypothetical protein